MISIQWIEKRRTHWERLEQLAGRAAHGLRTLNHAELQEFGLLYRQTASDLATALEDESGAHLAVYLNHLLGRSHNILYMGRRTKASGIMAFYSETYPQIFRENLSRTLLAVAIFVFALVAGWAVAIRDPGFAHRLLGPKMMETIDRKEMWTHSVLTVQPLAASAITTNNLTVAFTTYALGITVIGTIWMMLLNGLLLGVVGAATWHAGMAGALWSFVAPHGVLELPAIFIAGGAGLEIARGLLFPGLLPRREALAQAGGRATRLVLGSIPLLLFAGSIEAFFSPTAVPEGMKYALSVVLGSALMAWLFGAGKRQAD
jgi:uncharacterized membrane protein SpoIIM required for sporulation